MFIPIDNIHTNSAVLDRFEQLEQEKKNPQMAVFYGRKLVLIAAETDGFLEMVGQVFKSIIAKFLELVGFLSRDPAKIQTLKDQVKEYYVEQAKKYKEQEFENLEEKLRNECDKLIDDRIELEQDITRKQADQEDLIQDKRNQQAAIQTLNNQKQLLKYDINKIQAQYKQAKQAVKQKQALDQEVQNLNNMKNDLTVEVKRLQDLQTDTQDKVDVLQKELTQIQFDVQRKDYKTKYQQLHQEYQQLQQENKQSEDIILKLKRKLQLANK